MKREKRDWLVQTRVVKSVMHQRKEIVFMRVDRSRPLTKCIYTWSVILGKTHGNWLMCARYFKVCLWQCLGLPSLLLC